LDGEILPTNICKHKKCSVTLTRGSLDWGNATGCVVGDINPGTYSLENVTEEHSFPTSRSDIISQSLKDSLAKAKSPDLDVLTLLAEAKQTINGFKGATSRVMFAAERIARAARSRSRGSRFSATKIFADMWLEGRYGWRTAYLDAIALYDVLTQQFKLRSRGWDEVSGTTATYWDRDVWAVTDQCGYTVRLHLVTDWVIRSGSLFEVSLDLPNLGFNPAVTAWELIPYSFVVDWFLDVGESIQALSPKPGFHMRNLWVSERYVTHIESEVIDFVSTPPTAVLHGYEPQTYNGDWQLYVRRPATLSDVSYIPTFELKLNPFKVVDLLTLIIQSRLRVFRYLFPGRSPRPPRR
jgi:hypothetical protein